MENICTVWDEAVIMDTDTNHLQTQEVADEVGKSFLAWMSLIEAIYWMY